MRLGLQGGCALALAVLASAGEAAEVRFFRTDSKAAFAQGTAHSVSVGKLGELTLGSAVEELASIDQPYVYQAARDGNRWVVATGTAGLVVVVEADGAVTELPPLAEEHVFAVAARDGVVWAGTSPSGQLYRWDGETWTSFAIHRDGDLYIWALRPFEAGVYVATGAQGRVLRVTVDGEVQDLVGELDAHVRSLRLLPDGSLLAGTEGAGKIVRIVDSDARVLHVAGHPEVTALTDDDSGTCYAATVKSPASWVAGAVQQASAAAATNASATVTVTPGGGEGDGATSAVLRFACDGGVVETLDEWEGETVYDLAVYQGDVWLATGQEGKVYRLDSAGTRFLEHDLEESQAVGLLPSADHLGLLTTNGGKLLLADRSPADEGVFESAVFDAGLFSRVGALSWVGEGTPEFSVRSGQTGNPDEGWEEWSDWRSGRSIDFLDVASGRFLQWRARLVPEARLSRVDLAYRQVNVAPRITELEVLAAGEVLVDTSFNPGQQVFEPSRPARDGIFTALKPATEKDSERTKTLWKAGARTLRWKAEDQNDDELRYRVEVRPEDGDWLTVAEDVEASFLTIDATVLPDGAYRFRVTAQDSGSNSDAEALEYSRVTPLVFLDQTAPVLGKVARQEGLIEVEVTDQSSALTSIEVSRGGAEWQPARVADGSVDERSETVIVEIDEESVFVILRVTDQAHNHAVFTVPDS